jgi:hypothetical protein
VMPRGQGAVDRHGVLLLPVTQAPTVLAVDRLPTGVDVMISGEATKASIGVYCRGVGEDGEGFSGEECTPRRRASRNEYFAGAHGAADEALLPGGMQGGTRGLLRIGGRRLLACHNKVASGPEAG